MARAMRITFLSPSVEPSPIGENGLLIVMYRVYFVADVPCMRLTPSGVPLCEFLKW